MKPYRILAPDDPALAALANIIRSQPDRQTELVILAWGEYETTLGAALNADLTPYQAVCVPGHVWLPGLVEKGQLAAFEPLSGRLPENILAAYDANDLMPGVTAEMQIGGLTYSMPVFTDGHLLFFNKEYVDLEDGATVSSLALDKLASKARLHDGVHALALKAHPSEILLDWLPFLWEAGGDIFDQYGKPGFAGAEGVHALEYYVSLKKYCPPDTETFGNAEIAAALREGRVALASSWGGQAADIFSGETSLGIALFPRPWNATWGLSIPANQPLAVQMTVLERLYRTCGPELDALVTEMAGSPVRKSTYGDNGFSRYPWLEAQHEMLCRARTLPLDVRLGSFLGDLYAAVYRAFTGQANAKKALKQAEEKAIYTLSHTIK